MLATCEKGGVGLAIAHERGEWGWRSLMREGNGDGDKSISDGEQSSYSESTREALLCKKKP
jgi:hypothetical protein